jgi:hypothetical protein
MPGAPRRRCAPGSGLPPFTFAARLKGESEPLSTLFYLPPTPNVTYSAASDSSKTGSRAFRFRTFNATKCGDSFNADADFRVTVLKFQIL